MIYMLTLINESGSPTKASGAFFVPTLRLLLYALCPSVLGLRSSVFGLRSSVFGLRSHFATIRFLGNYDAIFNKFVCCMRR